MPYEVFIARRTQHKRIEFYYLIAFSQPVFVVIRLKIINIRVTDIEMLFSYNLSLELLSDGVIAGKPGKWASCYSIVYFVFMDKRYYFT